MNIIYKWDMGNGDILYGENISYTYPLPGNYIVTLTATDVNGDVDTRTALVYVSSSLETFVWDFGDGNYNEGQNVSNTYLSAGSYTPKLYVGGDIAVDEVTVIWPTPETVLTQILKTSFQLGFNMKQGIGFNENTGEWPKVDINGGAIKITDDNNNNRVIVLDSDDGLFYDITYGQHDNEDYIFTDKTDMDGNGYDISPEVTFKEDRGEYEKFTIENLSNRIYIRPHDEKKRGNVGFDERGFIENTEFTSMIYADGEPFKESAKTEQINGEEILYDRKVEGKRLQTKFISNKSSISVVGRQQEYLVKDVKYKPETRVTLEGNNQELLQTGLLTWLTRSNKLTTDKISKEKILLGDVIAITGTDNKNKSAFKTTDIEIISNSGSFVMFWSTNEPPGGFLQFGEDVGGWKLYYSETMTDIEIPLEYEVFDFRIYNEIKTPQLSYYFDDVKQNNADNVCPIW